MAVSQDVRDWLSSQPPSVVLDRDMSKRANLAHALSDGSVVAAIIEARYPLLLQAGPGVRAGVLADCAVFAAPGVLHPAFETSRFSGDVTL